MSKLTISTRQHSRCWALPLWRKPETFSLLRERAFVCTFATGPYGPVKCSVCLQKCPIALFHVLISNSALTEFISLIPFWCNNNAECCWTRLNNNFYYEGVEQIYGAGLGPIMDRWKTGVCVCVTLWACVCVEVILGFLLTAAGCG